MGYSIAHSGPLDDEPKCANGLTPRDFGQRPAACDPGSPTGARDRRPTPGLGRRPAPTGPGRPRGNARHRSFARSPRRSGVLNPSGRERAGIRYAAKPWISIYTYLGTSCPDPYAIAASNCIARNSSLAPTTASRLRGQISGALWPYAARPPGFTHPVQGRPVPSVLHRPAEAIGRQREVGQQPLVNGIQRHKRPSATIAAWRIVGLYRR